MKDCEIKLKTGEILQCGIVDIHISSELKTINLIFKRQKDLPSLCTGFINIDELKLTIFKGITSEVQYDIEYLTKL